MVEITTETISQVITGMKSQPQPRWETSAIQQQQIEAELNSNTPKDGMMRVITRMQFQTAPDLGEIDWDKELASFEKLTYPDYYLQPFHSILGGNLSERAALGNRAAMEAILENAHPRKSLGVRDEISQLFPLEAGNILDIGAGIGDGAAAIARRIPQSTVTVVEASPFMIIVGHHLHQEVPNLKWKHGLAENTELPDNSVDAINMTYVLHECPDNIKQLILKECLRILKPGGLLVVSDSLNGDLHSHRGFFEPYKEQWLKVNPEQLLTEAGFISIKNCQIAYRIWTRIAYKPK